MLWDKGIQEYIESARMVKASYPNVEFQLLGEIGSDNVSAISKEKILSWQEEGIVTYLGVTSDVRPYIKKADCVVLPSYREGLSRTLLEAGAIGRPVIATRVVGCKDIVDDGYTGFLVNPKDATDLDFSIEKNIKNIADSKNKDLTEINVCMLNRPRHKTIISKLNELKVNIKLLSDGDVSGALLVTDRKYKIDVFLGIGGGPEGVLAASALDAFNCKFQGRFLFKTEEDINRAKKMGITELNKKYDLNEIVKGDSVFCATGITSGDLVNGVKLKNGKFITETLVTHKNSTINIVKKEVPIT